MLSHFTDEETKALRREEAVQACTACCQQKGTQRIILSSQSAFVTCWDVWGAHPCKPGITTAQENILCALKNLWLLSSMGSFAAPKMDWYLLWFPARFGEAKAPCPASNMHITKACLAPCLQWAEPEALLLPKTTSAALCCSEIRRRPSAQGGCDPSPHLWQPLTPLGAHQAPLKGSLPTHLLSLTLSSRDTGLLDFTVLLSPSIEDKHFSEISHVNIMKKVYFYDSDR